MLRLLLVLVAILAFHAPAQAQSSAGGQSTGSQQAPGGLIGLAVRVRERDRIVGEVADVIERNEGIGVVVQIEGQDHRPVLIGPDALEREGGKLYLTISESDLRDLPTFESGSGQPDSSSMPGKKLQ